MLLNGNKAIENKKMNHRWEPGKENVKETGCQESALENGNDNYHFKNIWHEFYATKNYNLIHN